MTSEKKVLVCRSPKSLVRAFIKQFFWITNVKKVDIFLGEFNTNALSKEIYTGVYNVVTHCKFIFSKPTHIDGGLLCRLYFMKDETDKPGNK